MYKLAKSQGSKRFPPLGLLPYLICQHQTSHSPTVLLPFSQSPGSDIPGVSYQTTVLGSITSSCLLT